MVNLKGLSLACAISCLTSLGFCAVLDPATQNKYQDALPIPNVINMSTGGNLVLPVQPGMHWFGLRDPNTNSPLMTPIFGYQGTFPGPTILAKPGFPVTVTFSNELKDSLGNPLPHFLPIDRTLHWADPQGTGHTSGQYTGPIPIVTHLHGGKTPDSSDGHPDAWYTPNNALVGSKFVPSNIYPNNQEPGFIWYHDHALGISRVNVYAGMAGAYLLKDDFEASLVANNTLPSPIYDIPLVLQDREFLDSGAMYLPFEPTTGLQPNPTHKAQFFGRFMTVNGMIWPKLQVEPRMYRFRILNGSDSRFYELALNNGKEFMQIGSDSSMLYRPVPKKVLLMAPGERAEVLVDFSRSNGQLITLTNSARSPYPNGTPTDPNTDGVIMRFEVNQPLNPVFANQPVERSARFRPAPVIPLVQDGPTRQLVMWQKFDPIYARQQMLLGTVSQGALRWEDPVTETPTLNSTEVWEVYNNTGMAHPLHLHLTMFQVVNRQPFTASVNSTTGVTSNINFTGPAVPPSASEAGWEDTVIVPPRQVIRIKVKFEQLGDFVWHCHMLSHEDNDMMRPFRVVP